MKMKILLLGIISLLLLPNLVFAQDNLLKNWYEYLNIPEEYSRPPNLLYFVILPFIGTFAIIFGILTGTRAAIFLQKRVNVIISFVFTLSIFYAFSIPILVAALFQIAGAFSVVLFFIVFIGVTSLWGYRRVYGSYKETDEIRKKYRSAKKARISMTRDIKKIDKRVKKIDKRIQQLRTEIGGLSAQLGGPTPLLGWQVNSINKRILHKQDQIKDLQLERQRILERKDKLVDEYTKIRAT